MNADVNNTKKFCLFTDLSRLLGESITMTFLFPSSFKIISV